MTEQDIHALWPDFILWVTKVRGYAAVGGHWTIVLWYEFLETQKEGKCTRSVWRKLTREGTSTISRCLRVVLILLYGCAIG